MENNELIAEMQKMIKALRDELVERIDDSQTSVLRAFYGWSRPINPRLHSIEERISAAETRISTLEDKGL